MTLRVRKAGYENFRDKRRNALWGKIDHAGYLAAGKGIQRVMVGDLGAALTYTELGAEVHPESKSRFFGLWEGFCPDDRAGAQVNLFEITLGYRGIHFFVYSRPRKLVSSRLRSKV